MKTYVALRHFRMTVVGAALFWCALPSVNAAVRFKTVALTGVDGKYGPQLGPGVTYQEFLAHDINSSGHMSLRASLTGPESQPNETAIFLYTGDGIRPVARLFEPGLLGPQTGFQQFFGFGPPALDDSDSIMFEATAGLSPYYLPMTIWTHEAGQNRPLFTYRDEAMDTSTTRATRFENGRTMFRSRPQEPMHNQHFTYWLLTAEGRVPVAVYQSDGPLGPQLGSGVVFSQVTYGTVPLSASGHVAFRSGLAGPNLGASNQGVWRANADGPELLALNRVSGALGPNLGPTAVFEDFGANTYLDSQGNAAFTASFLNENVSRRGLFKTTENGNLLLASSDTDGPFGPQMGPGVSFSSPGPIDMNAHGEVLISAVLSGSNSGYTAGLWKNTGEANLPVAIGQTDSRLGPQLGPGIVFYGFLDGEIDDYGQVAFRGLLRDAGVDMSNDYGLWVWTQGSLIPLVREGDWFDVDTGFGTDRRQITRASLAPNLSFQSELTESFHSGHLAIKLEFSDGSSGIFVTQIPEPSSLALVVCGGTIIALWLRRRR